MTIKPDQKIAFLKKRHLFSGLSDEQIVDIANRLKAETHPPGKVVLMEGEPSNRFFLIYSGRVRITRKSKEVNEEQLAIFVAGDYFGEMGLVLRGPRFASVSTIDETLLLSLSREDFIKYVNQFPVFKINIDIAISSRQLARQRQFKWLFKDEVIYYLARKHKFLLWVRISIPIVLALFATILLVVGLVARSGFSFVSSAIGLYLYSAVIFPWLYIDWANDYYIVTNHRVIWLEKTFGFLDRRKEIPISAILSVDISTSFWGRTMDLGDVVMRTYTGNVSLANLSHPNQVAGFVTDQWSRLKEFVQKTEKEAIKQIIRAKLFGSEGNTKADVADPIVATPRRTPSFRQKIFSHFLRQRYEEGGTITYRKYWFVLVRESWKQFALLSIFILALLGVSLMWNQLASLALLRKLGTIVLIVCILYFLYRWLFEYLDWSNDFFQITQEQVIDVDRTPFGREQRSAAPLENILGVEYKQEGLAAIIFNFGTVYIYIGDKKLTFDEVYAPSLVQQEILQRMNARNIQEQEMKAKYEREQLAEWLNMYYHSVNEYDRDESVSKSKQNPD